ncbi:hypothetical protein HAX54_015791, partial [Datura stramonium]|nr:hypothetical protein [Datura stramonium]
MVKCLLESFNDVPPWTQRNNETIHNMEGQVNQLVEVFNAQEASIVDNSHEKNYVLEEEINTLLKEIRVEFSIEEPIIKCQLSSLKVFEDVNVEEVLLKSTKELVDAILINSSLDASPCCVRM